MKPGTLVRGLMLTICAFTAWQAVAQAVPSDSALALDAPTELNLEAQRERISVERAAQEAADLQSQRNCFKRFAVSDCLRQVRRSNRVVLDDLRRQEIVLNDLDRQSKAIAELARISSNTSPQRQLELLQQEANALQAQQQRQANSDEKKSVANQPRVATGARLADGIHSDLDVLTRQQRYNDKVLEMLQRKADKAKSLAENSGSSAKPLAVPASQ